MSALLRTFRELVGLIFHPQEIFPRRMSRRDLIILANRDGMSIVSLVFERE